MKTHITVLLFIIISSTSIAQELYQSGYIINKDGRKFECLIKNEGWVDSPVEIKYKLTEGGEIFSANLENTEEFRVGESKFVKETVDLDYSSNNPKELTKTKEPEFKQVTVFLRILVEGEASLLSYKSSDLRRFFMIINNEEPTPLVYKLYNASDSNTEKKILSNTSFRRQLMQSIICGNVTIERLTKIRYINHDLVKVFNDYNECKGSESITYKGQEGDKVDINLNVRPGLRFSSFETSNAGFGSFTGATFDDQTAVGYAIEFEFLLPGDNQKWGVLLEPSYHKFYSEGIKEGGAALSEAEIDYQSFELGVGLRYYMILTKDSKIFINGLFIFDKPLNDSYVKLGANRDVDSGTNTALGIGYNYGNRFFAEFRYGFKRDLLVQWKIPNKYEYKSIVLGIRIF